MYKTDKVVLAEKVHDQFHHHLDKCDKCRNSQFNLCPLGSRLLKAAAFMPHPSTVLKRKAFR